MNHDKIQIIILAGGKGKRMESDDPKALAILKGKPFLKHIIETIESLNFHIKPIIVVGHKKERIFEVCGKDHNYAHQEEALGTAHAVLSAKNSTHKEHQIVFLISADQPLISKETILKIIKNHQEKNSILTVGTVELPNFEEWRTALAHFGRVIRNSDGEVIKIKEYKDSSEEEKAVKEVNLGIYAFDKDWLWNNIDKIKNENAQNEYYITDLIKIASEQNKKIIAVPVDNILESLQPNSKAELEILENLLKIN